MALGEPRKAHGLEVIRVYTVIFGGIDGDACKLACESLHDAWIMDSATAYQ